MGFIQIVRPAGGGNDAAGYSYDLKITANGPRLVPLTFSAGTVKTGAEKAPDSTGNTSIVSSWGADTLTLTGGAEGTLSDNYWAAWEMPFLGDNLWSAAVNVQPDYDNWLADLRFGLGVFRSAAVGSFDWGSAVGVGNKQYVASAKDNAWSTSGFTTLQREAVGSILLSDTGQKIRSTAAWGTQANGNDSARSKQLTNLDSTMTAGHKTFIYLIMSGTGTIGAGDMKANIRLMGWQKF
ncbi:MAG: hypothetical protein DWQ49_08895 [Bacteroidetes bacterium]|nr:MAG: hypothetical protein DWQ49_08895 [Bacteroidota bacterium]